MTSRPDQSLNDTQQRAARYGAGEAIPGPLLIIAGAGTGKTRTLAHRVAHLMQAGADPSRILLLTFSRRAAAGLERSVAGALRTSLGTTGDASVAFAWAGTFHAVGARVLREYAGRVGLSSTFTIHDRSDAEDLMGMVRHEYLAANPLKHRFPGAATCLAIYSRVVNSEAPLAAVLRDTYPWCAAWEAALRVVFASYVAMKQAQQVLDFDDLLLYWAAMMNVSDLAGELGARFDHVLVDEYQDTNRLQGSILRALKPDGRGVTVVGDDAQAIYAFRAATIRNILDFPRQYDPPAAIITLERNYRSTAAILDASNAVIALAKERYTKNLAAVRATGERPLLICVGDEMAQAQCVAREVLRHRENGIALKRQAVLFRTSSHSALLELELGRRAIPFVKFGGLRFLEAAHVKDVLSLLRWIENPRARLAGFRCLRLLPGIGPAIAGRWLDALAGAPDALAAMVGFEAPAAAAQEWRALRALYRDLHAEHSIWPEELDLLLAWYEPQLDRLYEDAAIRAPDLAQLRRIATTYATRERFLTELTLDPPAATSGAAGDPRLDDDYLVLSTIHSAKGQEWRAVQVLNCVDGCIPSDMATGSDDEIEEERRLLYVAMTRAMDHLSLVTPLRFHVRQQGAGGDRHVYAQPSRFLTRAVRAHFDHVSWPPPEAEAPVAPRSGPTVDLQAHIRRAWAQGGDPCLNGR